MPKYLTILEVGEEFGTIDGNGRARVFVVDEEGKVQER